MRPCETVLVIATICAKCYLQLANIPHNDNANFMMLGRYNVSHVEHCNLPC